MSILFVFPAFYMQFIGSEYEKKLDFICLLWNSFCAKAETKYSKSYYFQCDAFDFESDLTQEKNVKIKQKWYNYVHFRINHLEPVFVNTILKPGKIWFNNLTKNSQKNNDSLLIGTNVKKLCATMETFRVRAGDFDCNQLHYLLSLGSIAQMPDFIKYFIIFDGIETYIRESLLHVWGLYTHHLKQGFGNLKVHSKEAIEKLKAEATNVFATKLLKNTQYYYYCPGVSQEIDTWLSRLIDWCLQGMMFLFVYLSVVILSLCLFI